jgi:hypothetical protein
MAAVTIYAGSMELSTIGIGLAPLLLAQMIVNLL